jgi:hypothetical protein
LNKFNIILTTVVMLMIGVHLGWYLRGVGMDKKIDEEAHRRLTNFVIGGVRCGILTIRDDDLFGPTETNHTPATFDSPKFE